jgi:hypothetical protein
VRLSVTRSLLRRSTTGGGPGPRFARLRSAAPRRSRAPSGPLQRWGLAARLQRCCCGVWRYRGTALPASARALLTLFTQQRGPNLRSVEPSRFPFTQCCELASSSLDTRWSTYLLCCGSVNVEVESGTGTARDTPNTRFRITEHTGRHDSLQLGNIVDRGSMFSSSRVLEQPYTVLEAVGECTSHGPLRCSASARLTPSPDRLAWFSSG